jgi:hypothetical protein
MKRAKGTLLRPSFMQLPEYPIRKAIANPAKIPTYIRNEYISKPLSSTHSALIADDFEDQAVRLAQLRTTEDFCLIVLDACRYDFLNKEFDKFFYGDCEPIWADSLNTFQYLRYLWPETYEYPYVTGAAPVTSQRFEFEEGEDADGLGFEGRELLEMYCGYVPDNHFENLVEVWREFWDEDLGVCPPEPVTEAAINASDSAETNRLVTHYFQPHGPFIGERQMTGSIDGYDTDVRGGAVESGIWSAVQNGEISKKQLRELYRANLRRALAAAAKLIHETDYDQYVIMGDHGEALGEYNRYYHGIEHPKVRVVPWATVDGVREDAPEMWEYTAARPANDETTVSRLRELGYLER